MTPLQIDRVAISFESNTSDFGLRSRRALFRAMMLPGQSRFWSGTVGGHFVQQQQTELGDAILLLEILHDDGRVRAWTHAPLMIRSSGGQLEMPALFDRQQGPVLEWAGFELPIARESLAASDYRVIFLQPRLGPGATLMERRGQYTRARMLLPFPRYLWFEPVFEERDMHALVRLAFFAIGYDDSGQETQEAEDPLLRPSARFTIASSSATSGGWRRRSKGTGTRWT